MSVGSYKEQKYSNYSLSLSLDVDAERMSDRQSDMNGYLYVCAAYIVIEWQVALTKIVLIPVAICIIVWGYCMGLKPNAWMWIYV